MKLLSNIYNYLFCALIFTIPFEDDIRIAANIIMVILFIALPFLEKEFLKKLIAKKIYAVTTVLVLFIALSSLVFGTFTEDFYVLKKLFIIIAVLTLSIPIKKDFELLLFFITAVSLGNLISAYNIINYTLEVGAFEIASGQRINDLLFIERLYFGFTNSLSVAFSIKIWTKASKKSKMFLVANILLSVSMLFLVVSRMAIITVLLIFIIKIFYEANLKKALIGIVLITGVASTFFLLNDNLKNRFLYADKKNDFLYKIREWEPRYVIWNCGFLNISNLEYKLLFGGGFYQTQQNLNNCYNKTIKKKNRIAFFIETRFNTHNQYLDLLLSKGLFTLAIFFYLIYYLFHKHKKNINQLNILLVLVLFALIENVFHRQVGVYLFAIIIVILTLKPLEENRLDE